MSCFTLYNMAYRWNPKPQTMYNMACHSNPKPYTIRLMVRTLNPRLLRRYQLLGIWSTSSTRCSNYMAHMSCFEIAYELLYNSLKPKPSRRYRGSGERAVPNRNMRNREACSVVRFRCFEVCFRYLEVSRIVVGSTLVVILGSILMAIFFGYNSTCPCSQIPRSWRTSCTSSGTTTPTRP